jgi:spermidine synthase
LVIGVGGGSVITSYVRDGWDVTAVEIDPAVTRLAAEFFKLDTTACKIVEGDGRRFLTTPSDEYNVIIVDAYGSSYIPPHLASAEAFALMKTKLSRDGILAINIQCVGWHDRIVASMAATLGVSFDNVIALPIAEPPDQYGNLVLMASDRQIALDSANSPPIPTDRFSYEYDRAHAWDNQFKPDLSRAIVFTDDLNPVDSWSGRINYAWRKSLHQTVSVSGLAW